VKLPPDTSLADAPFIPRNRVANLARLGLHSLDDLVRHFPRRHEDRRRFEPFPTTETTHPILARGVIVKTGYLPYGRWRRGFEAIIEEEGIGPLGGRLTLRWFNMPYVQKMIAIGMGVIVFGRVKQKGKRLVIDHPEFEPVEEDASDAVKSIHLNRIVPVHPAGEGISPRKLREWIHHALDAADLDAIHSLARCSQKGGRTSRPPDSADEVRSLASRLRAIHFPEDDDALLAARADLVFEEFFAMQLVIASRRAAAREYGGTSRSCDGRLLETLLAQLPFTPTAAQLRAIDELRRDLAAPNRMNRLLQGDVGSGKTLVALAAALLTIESGAQAAVMAPTQILAEQHYLNFHRLLAPLGLHIALHTGARKDPGSAGVPPASTPGTAGVSPAAAGILPAEDIRYSRRNLPHFERPWAKYAITFSTKNRRLLPPPARRVVLDAILHEARRGRFLLYAACVMPDHAHILIEPQIKGNLSNGNPEFFPLSQILHSIKSFTAKEINRLEKSRATVWEPESFDRLIRSETDLQEKFHYITRNPWDANLVSPTEDYPFVWWPEKSPGCAGVPSALADIVPGSVRQDAGRRRQDACAPQTPAPHLIVGTHALLYENAQFQNLGLVVIDEQHKFGVLQRASLIERGDCPDVLIMTATPIPRTLALTVYGDLDVSTLDELPPQRGKIITRVRDTSKLPDAAAFLREQIETGRQAFIIYPLIEESAKLEAKAAIEEFERWRALLDPFPCAILHGRLPPEEKESVMRDFRDARTKALITTTVVEVGVDVPNATLMLIENAERFGLAQLHQLRGRVGRGRHTSYCILMPGTDTPEVHEKLAVIEQTTDGFAIAEADLRLRGPGDLLGTAQTGLPPLKLGDLVRDADIMTAARRQAQALFAADPTLDRPEHTAIRNFLDVNDTPSVATA
jgi:RecG-like helicase/REP element-mobilizing transposase RayT